jgi:hypothetical protein
MPDLSRRHLVTTAAALPALAVPAAAGTFAQEPDPIFAAIEKHQRARIETCAAWDRVTDFERPFGGSITEIADDQEWCDLHNEAADAVGTQDDIARNLLHTQPTTVAGAAALLSYYVEAVSRDKQFFPENLDDDGNEVDAADISVYDSPPAFGYLLARNVARALTQIAVRS